MTAPNLLLAPWSGPYGGLPPFDQVSVSDLKPALEAAMAEQLNEVERIAGASEPAHFDNTVAAMERSGRTLDRVTAIYNIYTGCLSDETLQAVEREMEPKLAAFHDQITQNTALFARIAAVYETRENSGLTPEQQRLSWLYYTNFVHAGARLDAAAKGRLSAINQRLAALFTEFGQNILSDENDRMLVLEREQDLAGLPDTVRSAAAEEAQSHGLKAWVIANTRSSVEPFLSYSTRRELREQVWRRFVMRGDNDDQHDNKQIVAEILRLRAERARLLGFSNYAEWHLQDSMAKTPQRASQLMEAVWPAAVARAREEVADMQKLADRDGIRIEPWDYRYYAERVRAAKFDLDANAIKPYLELERLREGMFYVAERLFGLRFLALPRERLPTYHPDVRVWEAIGKDGAHVGLWFFDPYARRGKQSGAWMSAYRNQEKFAGRVTTIVSNNANFMKGRPGEPVLISWDDAVTLFHEFGHALHGLLSDVNYPSLSGTSVARDFVEFPSQLLEHWLATPEILQRFAVHHQTGAPMPEALIEKIERAKNFNQGFATVEFLASALVDMRLHVHSDTAINAAQFERDTLSALNMPPQIAMRHRIPQFSHIFSGDGYAAGYYSYLWADTLVADAWEAFNEASGPWDQTIAQRLLEQVFATGNTRDPADAYRAFRGRDPDANALMRKRGFPISQ